MHADADSQVERPVQTHKLLQLKVCMGMRQAGAGVGVRYFLRIQLS